MVPVLWAVGLILVITAMRPAAEAWYAARLSGALRRAPDPQLSGLPRVSIVVAARDEARRFAQAARSLLAQDHPDLELILVDDRSSDGTGALVDEAAAADPRVQAVHITDLPPGWLGKNHALAVGAARASGQWLLFTDGDVWLDPSAVRRAVGFAVAHGLDHLTVGPAMLARGYWLQGWVAFTLLMVMTFLSPRRMNRARGGFAVGAFNLVRRAAYLATGTHRAIALRPDDDVRLGMRLGRQGFRQWCAVEPDLVRVEWYPTVAEAIRGLEKNAFAVLEYRPAATLGVIVGGLVLALGPLVGGLILRGPVAWPYRAAFVLDAVTLWRFAATNVLPGRPWRAALVVCGYPVAVVLYLYAVGRSAWITLRRGGITWRGTFYPLAQLRRQTGLEEGTRPS